MGYTKRRVDEELEHGYSSIDSRVCNNCISDKDIKRFVIENGEESDCDYCNKPRKNTVSFNNFIEFFLGHIDSLWGNPLEELVNFEDSDNIFGIYDLLDECGIDITESSLWDDVIESLSNRQWCESPYYLSSESEILVFSWKEFSNIVKRYPHTYHFLDNNYSHEPIIKPNQFLDELSRIVSKLDLYKSLKKGGFLYRARTENKENNYKTVQELAPPPACKAKENRMSRAGFPIDLF